MLASETSEYHLLYLHLQKNTWVDCSDQASKGKIDRIWELALQQLYTELEQNMLRAKTVNGLLPLLRF